MFARDGGGIIFSAVAGAGEDGGESGHGGAPLNYSIVNLVSVIHHDYYSFCKGDSKISLCS